MSIVKVNTLQNTSGVEMYLAKAWLKFNQVSVNIDGSGNVSSVTDVGVGQITMNFSTAMANANYSATACAIIYGTSEGGNIAFEASSRVASPNVYSTTGVQTQYRGTYGEAKSDCTVACITITG